MGGKRWWLAAVCAVTVVVATGCPHEFVGPVRADGPRGSCEVSAAIPVSIGEKRDDEPVEVVWPFQRQHVR